MWGCCDIYIPKILPLVYNDALSYYENVLILIQWCDRLKAEIDASYKSLSGAIQNALYQSKQYTDGQIQQSYDYIDNQIAGYQDYLNNMESSMNNALSAFRAEMKQFKKDSEKWKHDFTAENIIWQNQVNTIVSKVESQIVSLWNALNVHKIEVYQYIDSQYSLLEEMVKNYTSVRNGNSILVYNPVQEKNDTLKNTLTDLADKETYGSITAAEYASLDLTAEQYADKQLTAQEYAYDVRFTFFDELYLKQFYQDWEDFQNEVNQQITDIRNMFIMVNPLDGRKVSIYTVIQQLASFHLDGLTVGDYALKEWTAEEYQALDWTAEFYAFSSAQALLKKSRKKGVANG